MGKRNDPMEPPLVDIIARACLKIKVLAHFCGIFPRDGLTSDWRCAIMGVKGGEIMQYRFQIVLTDDDYLNYNLFHVLRSPYKAKATKQARVLVNLIMVVMVLALLIFDRFRPSSLFAAAVALCYVLIYNLRYKKSIIAAYKRMLKKQKAIGKLGYTPESTLEFGEDFLVETSADNKNEQKYSAVERISVVKDRYVYLHPNSVGAYIIPMSTFASVEEYQAFFEFARANISENIDFYEKI